MISVWSRLKVEKKCPPSNHNSNPQQLLSYPRATCQTPTQPLNQHIFAHWAAHALQILHGQLISLSHWCSHVVTFAIFSQYRSGVGMFTLSMPVFQPISPLKSYTGSPTLSLSNLPVTSAAFFWLGCGTLRKIPRADRWHCRHRFPACSAVLAKSWEVAMNCTIICLPNCLSHAWLQNLISIQTVGENHKPWWVMVKFNVTLYRKYGHVPKSRAFHSN